MAVVSEDAVRNATGRGWDEWFAALDERGARDLEHKGIVRVLREDEGVESGWWCQSITVRYEQHIGRRIPGQTSDAECEVGVRKTLPVAPGTLWDFITGSGLGLWLEGAERLPVEAGESMPVGGGGRVQLRSVDPGKRLRLWLCTPAEAPHTVLQVTLIEARSGTTIGFHHERLSGPEEREQMRERWRAAAARIAEQLA